MMCRCSCDGDVWDGEEGDFPLVVKWARQKSTVVFLMAELQEVRILERNSSLMYLVVEE